MKNKNDLTIVKTLMAVFVTAAMIFAIWVQDKLGLSKRAKERQKIELLKELNENIKGLKENE